MPCTTRELLDARRLAAGTLADWEHADIEAHVADCAECQAAGLAEMVDDMEADLENAIDPRLLELAQTDATVHAAIQAHRNGLALVHALTAAVVDLARWRREWSPEAMRAMMMAPPAPIYICCTGKHDAVKR